MPAITRYVLTYTRMDSTAFGPCQVCGNHASRVWLQVQESQVTNKWVKMNELAGHLGCLELQQKLSTVSIGSPAWWLAQFGYTVTRQPRPGPLQFGATYEVKGSQGETVLRNPSEAEMAELIRQLMREAA